MVQPNQIPTFFPIVTSPQIKALGATQAEGSIVGAIPR
jgi:hypothetical protein